MPVQPTYPSPARRALITASVVTSTMIVALDATIANVALPHMQSSLSATPEQVMWVLTSYLIASAIMTPLAGWLASRFGRKRVMALSTLGFTLASLACGLANSLEFMVFARLLQGICGAGLVPLGQSTLLDINPPEKQGKAMTMTGLGAMLGPLSGPTLGGWLTDSFSWRWVFLINIPIGLIALAGIILVHIERRESSMSKFDLMGFATISLFLGSFQLVMDRGLQLDWLDSTEICIEVGIMLLAGYMSIVHIMTRNDTFVRAGLFADSNFTLGCLVSAVVGIVVFASSPIITVMTQSLLGYSALQTGMVGFPRGVGTVVGLIIVGQVIGKTDSRLLLIFGLIMEAFSLYLFSQLSLYTDTRPMLIAGFLQGIGGGFMIAPLSVLAYATLAPGYRNEGTAIYSLARSMGNSIGISVVQIMSMNHTAAIRGNLADGLRPDNPVVQWARPDLDFESTAMLARLAGETARQAAMVATVETYRLGYVIALASIPVALIMRGPRRKSELVPIAEVHQGQVRGA